MSNYFTRAAARLTYAHTHMCGSLLMVRLERTRVCVCEGVYVLWVCVNEWNLLRGINGRANDGFGVQSADRD